MMPLLRSSFCIGLLVALAGPAAADTATPSAPALIMVAPDSTDASRVIPLEGALNVRELGGLEGDHGAVPLDHFIRAANLAKLTAADRDALYKRGVVLDIDLRTAGEEQAAPDALVNDPHIRYLPISLLGSQPLTPSKMSTLRDMYVDALANDQLQFKQVFEAIAAAGQGAVLYHCTAGKDRTGMISAMLLQLAGVPRDQIVHNYAVSAYYLQPMISAATMSQMIKTQPAIAALMGSPPDAIEGFLDALDSRYGGSAAYLQAAGVSASDIAKIRGRLTP
jgi:protein-tyrosine phosphatase